ncbi:MAG: hypothetical protein SGCHY_003879 [Lobulomycetales sp.]
MAPSSETDAKLDWLFLKRFARIIKLLFSRGPFSVLWTYVALLVLKSTEEVVSYYSGVLVSSFYRVLSDGDRSEFTSLVLQLLAMYTGQCILQAFSHYAAGVFALRGRVRLTRFLQDRYLTRGLFYPIASSAFLDNPDQRIAQDIDRFTEASQEILEKVAIIPGLIVYCISPLLLISADSYRVAELNNGNFLGPGLIYAYFFVTTIIVKLVLAPLIPLVFSRERAEGDYRFLHVRLREFAGSVAMMHGEHFEKSFLDKGLDAIVGFQSRILNWKVFALFCFTFKILSYFVSNLVAYSGAIMSYIVIAIPIFTGVLDGKPPGELSEIIAKNTFLCLYLISCFTAVVYLADIFSEVAGYTARIGQFIDIVSRDDSFDKDVTTPPADSPPATATDPGDNLLIIGRNGCGKSTLMKTLAGVLPSPTHGSIKIPDFPKTMFIPQIVALPHRGSIMDALEYGCTCYSHTENCHGRFQSFSQHEVTSVLQSVGFSSEVLPLQTPEGLAELLDLASLSPGERCRILIARLLLWKPRWAFLDETLGSIDPLGRREMISMMNTAGIGLVLVDHSLGADIDQIAGQWKKLSLKERLPMELQLE